ncbi:MAG TPA: DUF5916 domain-containing protein [Pseudosphingobacterium sp.]|nr:DUF5916 domain-containing protein [Pseudosphingobacterium sp.]
MKYFLFIFLLTNISVLYGQDDRTPIVSFDDAYKRNYQTTKIIQGQPKIDGKLDESLWQDQGEWSEKFSEVIPFERAYTGSWTRMKIFYDEKNIYVGVYCKDIHPETMNAFIGNRDDNSNGDLISIAFDPYHDYRAAVEFNINLGGNKTDLTVTDRLSVNLSWNAVWEGRTHQDLADSSWTAELRIPFNQIRYNQKNDEGIWGLHVRRIIRRNNEVQNWSMIPIKNNGHVFSFGEMHGMEDLPRPKGIEFLPYVMNKLIREPKIANNPYRDGSRWKSNAGLDAKFAIRDYTMDLSINPDYGQVELDPSVMNLTAYEVFYEEKRPFFLEGKHILEFDNNEGGLMFYSRRIGATPRYRVTDIGQQTSFASTPDFIPILGAMKLTGTNKKGLTIGILESVTAKTSASVTRVGNEERIEVEPLTNYTVARVQKNWEGNTLLGGMITSVNRRLDADHLENFLVKDAFAAGIDFTKYFSNRLYYVETKAMYSTLSGSSDAILTTKRNATHFFQRKSGEDYLRLNPEATSLSGTGGYIKAGKKGNAQWNYSQTFSWSSPGFDLNEVGYLKQTDYKLNESELAFRKTDPWGPFRFAGINLTQRNVWNYGGKAMDNNVAIRWRSLSIKNRIEMDFKETFSWNTVDSRMLRGGTDLRYNQNFTSKLSINTDRARRIILKVEYDGKHFMDGETRYNEVRPSMTFRMGNHTHLVGQFNYAWNKDNLQYVSTLNIPSPSEQEGTYVMGRMRQETYGLTIRLQENITPDLSIQYYASPFTSTARYDRLKYADNTLSKTYNERFREFSADQISYTDGSYTIETGGQTASFKDPNFSFNEFRSNLVARWEYRPGSTLYLVWEHNRSGTMPIYQPGWTNNLDQIWGIAPTNTFMVKVNYWIGW